MEAGLLGQEISASPPGQGDQLWLASPLHRKGHPAEPIPPWPAWPVLTPTVAIATASVPAISAWSSGPASTSTSGACTAPPAAIASANARGPLAVHQGPRRDRRPRRHVPRAWVLDRGRGRHLRRGPRTVARLLERAGHRAADSHELQRDRRAAPPEVVQLDELHGRVSPTPAQKGGRRAPRRAPIAPGVAPGLMRHWRSSAAS